MRRRQFTIGLLAIGALAALGDGRVQAQLPAGNQFGQRGVARPTTSPYLNLLQGGNNRDLALDYFRLVKPEQEWRRYTSGLNQRLNLVEGTLSGGLLPDGSVSEVRRTGHATTFLNTGSYFPRSR